MIQEITELNLLWARTLLNDLNPAGPPKTIIHNNSDDRGVKRTDSRCHFIQNYLQFQIHVCVWVRKHLQKKFCYKHKNKPQISNWHQMFFLDYN